MAFGGSMSPATVSYGCTALLGTNKKGILKCDADGYYCGVVLGALNHFNSAGKYYPLQPAKMLFDASSSFMRRVKGGNLRGECGHPRPAHCGSDREFILRLNDIYEPNVSHHIRKVWLEEGHTDEQGRPVVLVLGDVKPAGPRGPALKAALDNPNEDVCFSIRCFTHDYPVGGVWNKAIREIVTWDWVNEPGISAAHKWRAPTLESFEERCTTREFLMALAKEEPHHGYSMEAHSHLINVIASMGWDQEPRPEQPPSAHW